MLGRFGCTDAGREFFFDFFFIFFFILFFRCWVWGRCLSHKTCIRTSLAGGEKLRRFQLLFKMNLVMFSVHLLYQFRPFVRAAITAFLVYSILINIQMCRTNLCCVPFLTHTHKLIKWMTKTQSSFWWNGVNNCRNWTQSLSLLARMLSIFALATKTKTLNYFFSISLSSLCWCHISFSAIYLCPLLSRFLVEYDLKEKLSQLRFIYTLFLRFVIFHFSTGAHEQRQRRRQHR